MYLSAKLFRQPVFLFTLAAASIVIISLITQNAVYAGTAACNKYLQAGGAHSTALKPDGTITAWGSNASGQCGVPAGNDFVAVAAGGSHSLAIRSDGTLAAWGNNTYGQTNVPSGSNYISISGGQYHSVALRSDGTLAAWGSNYSNQCNIPAGNDFTAISAGNFHSLALRTDGTIAAWGDNSSGQCNAPSGNNYIAVAAGGSHSLTLKSDGTLAAWGSNTSGQIDIPAGTFTAIEAGNTHSLALSADGTLAVWGGNSYNQCSKPTGEFAAISAGGDHSLALRADGTVVAWGNNGNGQCTVPSAIKLGSANISSLLISPGTITPFFDSNKTTYTVDAPGLSSISATINTADQKASLCVNGDSSTGGIPVTVNLSRGRNNIPVFVSSLDGLIQKTYNITVFNIFPTGTGIYTITPSTDSVYTCGETPDGITTMTVNDGYSGFKYFLVSISPVVEHEGAEVAVFIQRRNEEQVGMSVIKCDLDVTKNAGAGFNVKPGDVIKAYVVDNLSNDPAVLPIVLK